MGCSSSKVPIETTVSDPVPSDAASSPTTASPPAVHAKSKHINSTNDRGIGEAGADMMGSAAVANTSKTGGNNQNEEGSVMEETRNSHLCGFHLVSIDVRYGSISYHSFPCHNSSGSQ